MHNILYDIIFFKKSTPVVPQNQNGVVLLIDTIEMILNHDELLFQTQNTSVVRGESQELLHYNIILCIRCLYILCKIFQHTARRCTSTITINYNSRDIWHYTSMPSYLYTRWQYYNNIIACGSFCIVWCLQLEQHSVECVEYYIIIIIVLLCTHIVLQWCRVYRQDQTLKPVFRQ